MATIPETDMTVLWLQLGAPGRTPVLCMRCDNKGHCLLKAAKNLALSEGVSSRPVEIDFRLHQEIFEALHGQQNSIWHVGNGYGCIVECEGVRAIGIASKSEPRRRATMLSIAMSLRVR